MSDEVWNGCECVRSDGEWDDDRRIMGVEKREEGGCEGVVGVERRGWRMEWDGSVRVGYKCRYRKEWSRGVEWMRVK